MMRLIRHFRRTGSSIPEPEGSNRQLTMTHADRDMRQAMANFFVTWHLACNLSKIQYSVPTKSRFFTMPRKSKTPNTLKEHLQKLVSSCEECGSKDILIVTYQVQEGYQKPKGFLGSLGELVVPADPEEREQLRKERNKKPGLLIRYFCKNCRTRFETFYDEKSIIRQSEKGSDSPLLQR